MGQRGRSRGRVAVLLVADQRRGRSPDHCVKTGQQTSSATRATAVDLPGAEWWQLILGAALTRLVAVVLRRKRLAVVVAVTPTAWAVWRWRVVAAIVAATAGAGIAAAGLLGGRTGFVVFRAVVPVVTWLWRMWMAHTWWFGLRLRDADGHILVHRASASFDADARRLFADAQRRR